MPHAISYSLTLSINNHAQNKLELEYLSFTQYQGYTSEDKYRSKFNFAILQGTQVNTVEVLLKILKNLELLIK